MARKMKKIITRKGAALEKWLDDICTQLNSMGCHAHKNHPRRSYDGFYLEGEPFDYEFFINGQIHCFDAKENMSGVNEWQILHTGAIGEKINARTMREAINLMNCAKGGAQSYFLVFFGNEKSDVFNKLIRFEASIIYAAMMNKETHIHYSEGQIWDLAKIINAGDCK